MRRILLTGEGYDQHLIADIRRMSFEVIERQSLRHGELLEMLPSLDGYVLGGVERLTAELLAVASSLRLIAFVGSGAGSFVDIVAAESRGIATLSTPGVNAAAVAEHAVGLVLGAVRGLFAQNEACKRGGSWLPTDELRHVTVGILGMGAVGYSIARILRRGFECEVYYSNRNRRELIETDLGVRFVDTRSLISSVRVLVLALAEHPETSGVIDSSALSSACRGLILVNPCSPRLIDVAALKGAMEDGIVSVFAQDGYWVEPIPHPAADEYGLLGLSDDRVIITPHAAASTNQTWSRMTSAALDNVIRFFGDATVAERKQ